MTFMRVNHLRSGETLPSGRELATSWGVSRAAMSRVLHQLEGSGLLWRDGNRLRLGASSLRDGFVVQAHVSWPEEIEAIREIIASRGGSLEVHPHQTMRKSLLDSRAKLPAGIITTHRDHLDLLADLKAAGSCVVLCHHEWKENSFVTGDHVRLAAIAVDHLHTLGHREIAFLYQDQIVSHRVSYGVLADGYRSVCAGYDLPRSARRVHKLGNAEAGWEKIFAALTGGHRPVTGIVCAQDHVAFALLRWANAVGIRVPEQLSIVSTHESPDCATCEPPLTTAGIDRVEVTRIAAGQLCTDILERRLRPGAIRKHGVRCQPVLTVRGSTAVPSSAGGVSAGAAARGREGLLQSRWSDDAETRRLKAEQINGRTHARGGEVNPVAYHPLDLSETVNRAFGPRSSWLGDLPLLHFEPGEHRIHGIPFRVCKGQANPSHVALVLRSARSRTSGGKPLPVSATLVVGQTVRAIYFLHAAGWTYEHACIANYHMRFASGREETLPVIAQGPEKPTTKLHTKWMKESVVQDWHPNMEPFPSDRALPFIITEKGDPLLYERYLHTCEWVNPFPDDRLEQIVIESADPDTAATLAVLAITIEKAATNSDTS